MQLLRLVIGAALAYSVWGQVVGLPSEVRLTLAVVLGVIGVLFGLLQPGGRSLDHWLVAGALFVVLPRRLGWQSGAAPLREPPARAGGLGRARTVTPNGSALP